MKQAIVVIFLVAGCLATKAADARSRWYSHRGGRRGYGGVGTPQSAYLHGMADVIRSEGMYNQRTSQGLVNQEQARSKYIDNLRKWNQVYHERKQMAASDQAREVEVAREAHAKYVQHEHSGMPPRLTHSQLDTATGKLAWPSALQADGFAKDRGELESLFALRAHTGHYGNMAGKIYDAAHTMEDDLRKQIHDLPTHDYIAAHRFLDSLAYEGRYPSR